MLENLSRAFSSLLFGAWGRCLRGLWEGEEDGIGICGDDLEILGDERDDVLNFTGEDVEGFDKLEEDDWNLLLGPLNEPACLPGEIFLPGEPALPLFVVDDLFLSMEWVITPDPLPVYNLSPMDMVSTIKTITH